MIRCDFRPFFDPITEEPFGPRCPNAAVARINWDDGRFSHACAQHGADSLDAQGKQRVLSSEPLA